ncbi:MAG: Asp-tRNA(Asn)/Glu-tRNA(Gln) amidotransferase subunit GatC [Alphaproteobacteria bacterium]
MSIDNKTVKDIAFLSRLAVKDEDLEKISKELSGIIGWVEQLAEIDIEGVEPMVSVAKMSLRRRKDEVKEGDAVDKVILNAPDADDGCFLVPKVVE